MTQLVCVLSINVEPSHLVQWSTQQHHCEAQSKFTPRWQSSEFRVSALVMLAHRPQGNRTHSTVPTVTTVGLGHLSFLPSNVQLRRTQELKVSSQLPCDTSERGGTWSIRHPNILIILIITTTINTIIITTTIIIRSKLSPYTYVELRPQYLIKDGHTFLSRIYLANIS